MLLFFYNWILNTINPLILNYPLGNSKFKLWQKGQKNISTQYQTSPSNAILFFIASSGEFEQAKPILEYLKSHKNDLNIIVSFYSPSGFESLKKHPLIDFAIYTPLDTNKNASFLINSIRPKVAVFAKYELWLNIMSCLNKTHVPCILFSGVFQKNHFLFKWYGKPWLKQLSCFKKIYVQDNASVKNLEEKAIKAIKAGDTRIDRSLELPSEVFYSEQLESLNPNTIKVILGSLWPGDLSLFSELKDWLKENKIQLIIAPHELEPLFLDEIIETLCAVKYSSNQKSGNKNILIDQIGILKYIYRYGDIAYIGGGFGKGIHNTLEPTAYGLPVLFGPRNKKFVEAQAFINNEGGFEIKSAEELKKKLLFLINNHQYKISGEKARAYLIQNKGASKIVSDSIFNYL